MRRIPAALAVLTTWLGVLAVLSGSATATYSGRVGRLAFGIAPTTGNGKAQIYSVLPNGHNLRRLTHDNANNLCPAYSANGRRIVFCSDRTGAWEIWTMHADGSHQRQVTKLGGYATFPDFSPNGRWIAFGAQEGKDKHNEIYRIRADGTGLTRLTHNAGNNYYPAWSPDGEQIAFTSTRTGTEQVYVMNTNGSDQHQLTHSSATHDEVPDWSPNGRQIAYEAGGKDYEGRIFVMNANGTHRHRLTGGPGKDFGAAWSPSGNQIAYCVDFGHNKRTVYVINANGSDPHPVHTGGKQYVPGWQPTNSAGHDA